MRNTLLLGASACVLLAACGSSETPKQGEVPQGQAVDVKLNTEDQAERDRLLQILKEHEKLSTTDFFKSYQPLHQSGLGFDPLQASQLSFIKASSLGLNTAEEQKLSQNGFVISARQEFPSFTYGYQTIYLEDLPLYVSADSILTALHRSFESILKTVEIYGLRPNLGTMLKGMRQNLAAGAAQSLGAQTEADLDIYLTVALSLLEDQALAPVKGGDASRINALFQGAKAASGMKSEELFGKPRKIDFSQFDPRGHYRGIPDLETYFRAMMWLGRIDLRLVETQPDHSQVFHRDQLKASFGLLQVMGNQEKALHKNIDETIGAFVGEADNMTVAELDALLNDLGLASADKLDDLSDRQIAQTILNGGYGTQRISSHIMINGVGEGTMPLSSTFLLLGQRYVVDSHVFSNVVYDRVQRGAVKRMMPSPLDVAFAALGNDQAGQLLAPEIQKYNYQSDLASMRTLVDAHGGEFWKQTLYNRWLGAVRTLSQSRQSANLPSTMRTEAWGKRVLNTQLASWAELRHDTLLYAKQSYTGGAACEFPDAYVDPYPELYGQLMEYAQHGKSLISQLNFVAGPGNNFKARLDEYFTELYAVSEILKEMAEYEIAGTPFTQTHMAFINETVRVQQGCGTPAGAEGWYARLLFNPADGSDYSPTIADVHTQPTDEVGNPVGKVLHVGTGSPRVMVVTVQTCNGPRAYVGLVNSYFEEITGDYKRLNDQAWEMQLNQQTPADPLWMQDIISR